MDTPTLVTNQTVDGRRLIQQLVAENFDVTAACWIKTGDPERWYLYVASRMVEEKGLAEAYGAATTALRHLPTARISMWEFKLVGATSPLAAEVVSLRDRSMPHSPCYFQGWQLGGIPTHDAYIYPASAALGGPVVLAKGKEAVLEHLEKEAQGKAGHAGEYMLVRDEDGKLVAFIAGHSFVDTGTVNLGESRTVDFELAAERVFAAVGEDRGWPRPENAIWRRWPVAPCVRLLPKRRSSVAVR